VGALLALIVAAPALWHFNWRHWMWAGAILVTLGLFAAMAAERLQKLGPSLQRLEYQGPR